MLTFDLDFSEIAAFTGDALTSVISFRLSRWSSGSSPLDPGQVPVKYGNEL